MKTLYRGGTEKLRFIDVCLSVVFAYGYYLCLLPSFNNIGKLPLQIFSALILSFICTLIGLFLKNSLKFLGIALSLFTISITAIACYKQVLMQIETGNGFKSWIYQFYYDRPLTVALVWGAAFLFVTVIRISLPVKILSDELIYDYKKFLKFSTRGFFAFYGAFLLYGFFLQRSVNTSSGYNFIPFNMIQEYLSGAGSWYESFVYLFGNTFCFMPIGFFILIFKPEKKWKFIVFLPVAISVSCELIQLILKMGNCDIDDTILNCFGYSIGVFFKLGCDKFRSAITGGEETTIFALN